MDETQISVDQNCNSERRNVVVHEHHFHVNPKGIVRMFTAPILLGAAVAAMVKTEGEYEQINWLVPVFAALCIWTNI